MPLINHAKGEINAKIVYVGPASAGKATNLNHIYGKLKESFRGSFKSMNIQNDRMLFFDFTPSGQGKVNGYGVRFHIYTVTGEVSHPSSWKMVLKGADGIVFVADSAPDRMAANVECLKSLTAALAAYGKTLSDVPCVIQCNKRDLAGALDLGGMGRTLNPANCPIFPAVAGKGEGVLESVFALVKEVLKQIRAGGLELEGEPEQFQRMAAPVEPERHEAPPVAEAGHGAGSGMAPEAPAPAPAGGEAVPTGEPSSADDEPVIEIAGAPEILQAGRVRLPLSVRYGGKAKRMALEISLTPDLD